MKLKTLGLTFALASVGWFGVSGEASAAKFKYGDQININVSAFQINNATSLPTGEFAGGADGFADALFGTGSPSIDASNRVINKDGEDVVPGVTGDFTVGSSLGGFRAYQNKTGEITSFDGFTFLELTEVNGAYNPYNSSNLTISPAVSFTNNFLMRLENGTPDQLNFYLTEIALGDENNNPITIDTVLLTGQTLIINGKGWLAAKEGDDQVGHYPVEYQLIAQSLKDDGLDGDPVAGDQVTRVTTLYASSLVATIAGVNDPQGVPEPSTLVGLSAVVGASLLMKKKK